MGTAKFIVLAQSGITARALLEYLRLSLPQFRNDRSINDRIDLRGDINVPALVWKNESLRIDAYRSLAARLEEAASTDGRVQLNEVVVLVDQVDFAKLNPIAEDGWNHVVAMLILAFPEFRWVFGAPNTHGDQRAHKLAEEHSLVSFFHPHYDPLFDGTGLREWVRQRARQHVEMGQPAEAAYLPCRSKVAIAIDDERNYAYFHAYTAYRHGFLAYSVTEESLMLGLLGTAGRCDSSLRVSIEDLYLNFPDRSSVNQNTHWSHLAERSKILEKLDAHKEILRVFVTAGQREGEPDERKDNNRWYRKNLHKAGRLGSLLFKPTSGIFDLWKRSGLTKILRGGRQPGQAEGFLWPPVASDEARLQGHGHSAPGRLLEIAEGLITRAERMIGNTQSVPHATQGAVLALDALELLGEKAQTTFGQALALKHQFEALAECQFYGVQSHFDVRSRKKDVQLEVGALGKYFNRKIRREAQWNVETAVLNALIRTYREYNQFDEEQALQGRSRALHRKLWFKRRMGFLGDQLRWVNPLYWIACYINGLLRSLPIFLLLLVLWVAGLSWMFRSAGNELSLQQGFQDAVTSFFSVGGPIHQDEAWPKSAATVRSNIRQSGLPPVKGDPREIQTRLEVIQKHVEDMRIESAQSSKSLIYVSIVCLAIVAGFVHLGIFISHLYSVVSRK